MTTDHDNGDVLNERIKETLDRVRRFETRFTRFLSTQNFDTQTEKPVWKDGAVHLPSLDCSLADILLTIPRRREEDTEIIHKGTSVCWIAVDEPEGSDFHYEPE